MSILHRTNFWRFLLVLLGCGMSVTAADTDQALSPLADNDSNYEENLEAQWALWPYLDESIRWHTDWTRWHAANATVQEHFRAYRDLGPDPTKNASTLHTNTYFYEDERGTVANCGAMCGPWELDRDDPRTSSTYGIVHPSRDYMRTINLPDRSLAWIPKDLPSDDFPSPAGFELFLGDGGFLRLSVGIVYDATGALSRVSALREDSRGFGQFWAGTAADPTPAPELQMHTTPAAQLAALGGCREATTGIRVSVPGLAQTELPDPCGPWQELSGEDLAVFELPDDGIVMACPHRLPADPEDGFAVAVAWKRPDGTRASFLEAVYKDGTMSHVDYTVIATPAVPEDSAATTTHGLGGGLGILGAMAVVAMALAA